MTDHGQDDLAQRIARAKAAHVGDEAEQDAREQRFASMNAGGMILRYAMEFVASVLVGILFGVVIDHFAGTSPWGLLIMLALGLASGVLSVIRAYRRMTALAQAGINTREAGQIDGTEGE